MTKEEKVKYWLDIADYDLETAEVMYNTGRWLYVGFMCHQVLEKTLKACWCAKRDDDVPYLHNLNRLATSTGLLTKMSEDQLDFLDRMIPMNIEARYPSYKEKISEGLNAERCKYILDETKQLQAWIKNTL